MTDAVFSNGGGGSNGFHANGNDPQSDHDVTAAASGQSSPRSVRFDPFAVGPPHTLFNEEIQTTVDRPRVPERSMSNITISDDSKKSHIDPIPRDCTAEDCAFGWTTYVLNHACKVPHTSRQRVSIHSLLHEEQNNPILEPYTKDIIRYAHLPANNMTWVEDLIKRYYHHHEDSTHQQPSHKQLRLLRRDFWYGQQHGNSGPIHARFMRPRCDIVPRDFHASASNNTGHIDFVIAMPYLHWETDENREKTRRIIANVQKWQRRGHKVFDASNAEAAAAYLPLSKWGKACYVVARKLIYEKLDPDEKLLRKYLLSERPVHIRRTLDQSYYWTLKNTQMRDQDQVVYRATEKASRNPQNRDAKQVVMVDQLWVWILDGRLVISSFPRRWASSPPADQPVGFERNKSDPSGLFRTIRERLDDRPNLENAYDLATLLMDQCSRVFFDRTVPLDNRPEVIDIFANAIGDVTDRATNAWMDFWDLITPNSKHYRDTLNKNPFGITAVETLKIRDEEEIKHQRLLDINPEGEILREVKDILDELHIMNKVFQEQIHVASEFSSHIHHIAGKGNDITQKTKDQSKLLVKEIGRRQSEIHELTRAAERTANELKELLDLKQKHANVFEARAGVQRAEEANKILKATSDLAGESAIQTAQGVKQAVESSKQNRSLMIFTIVTIIFLPLSFISSVFGMNAPELSGQGSFHLWKQFLIMFPVSITIILFSLALALSEDFLGVCGTWIQLKWANFLDSIGLFERWKKKGERVKAAIKRRKAELDRLYPDPDEISVPTGDNNA